MDIVIPYVHGFSSYDELRYALRSIDANLQGDYRIFLVGDPPPWIHRVHVIKMLRCSIGSGSNLNDVTSKLDVVVSNADISQRFIRWYDDIYLLKQTDQQWFDQHWSVGNFNFISPNPDEGVYKKHLYDTWQELKHCKLPEYNCEVHMPRIFDKDKLKDILYNHIIFCGKRKLMLSQSLYFNTYYPESRVVLLKKNDDVKAGFYGHVSPYSFHSTDLTEIFTICKNKHILNHDDTGWSEAMKAFLYTKFPNKSRYEK